jgi:large subunit ribosomal protein L9
MMNVILLEDLPGKGTIGDVVKVADGYARNMLFPRNMALPANEANVKVLEHRKAKIAEIKATSLAEAQEVAEKISGLSVTLTSKAGEGGKLFGSITSQDVAEAIHAQHDIFVDKKKIQLSTHIKEVGEYSVDIKVYSDIVASVTVKVEEQ